MPPRLIAGATVLLILCLAGWWLMALGEAAGTRTPDDSAANSPVSVDSDESVSYTEATQSRAETHDPMAHMPEWFRRRFGSLPYPDITLAQAEQFLANHGRSAPNLLAAFWHTRHAPFAEEVLAAYPDDPVVILQALYLDSTKTIESPKGPQTALQLEPEHREELLAKLEALDPNNAAVRQLRLVALVEAGDIAGAIDLMRNTPASMPWEEYDAPIREAITQMSVDVGRDPLAARWTAQHQMNDLVLDQPQYAAFEVLANATVNGPVPEDLRQSWAELLFAYAEGWAARPPRQIMAMVAANATQDVAVKVLEELDIPGSALARDHVSERTQRLERLQPQASLALRYMTETEAEIFVDRLTADGQLVAWEWMIATVGPRIPPEVIQAEEQRRRERAERAVKQAKDEAGIDP